MRAILLGFAVLLLSACAGQRDIPGHITYTADGKPVYLITCDRPFSNQADCLARAGQICREKGYSVSRADDRTNILPELKFRRTMTIRCNTPSGLYPGDEPEQR